MDIIIQHGHNLLTVTRITSSLPRQVILVMGDNHCTEFNNLIDFVLNHCIIEVY